MPFTNASLKAFRNAFGFTSDLEDKLQVLYPAIRARVRRPRDKTDDVYRVLFISNGFFEKGGRELVHAVEELRARGLNLELWAIASVPDYQRSQYDAFLGKYRNREGFHITQTLVPRRELFENYYAIADIFAFPSYGDFAGYVILEAMSMGLPIVATDVFAIPEFVKDGENGYLIQTPISPFRDDYLRRSHEEVEDYLKAVLRGGFRGVEVALGEALTRLVEDDSLRRRMAQHSLERVLTGEFSIGKRNAKLKRIYDHAVSASG
jgi:glycosyltransferase involved in cell wall biosynthesis